MRRENGRKCLHESLWLKKSFVCLFLHELWALLSGLDFTARSQTDISKANTGRFSPFNDQTGEMHEVTQGVWLKPNIPPSKVPWWQLFLNMRSFFPAVCSPYRQGWENTSENTWEKGAINISREAGEEVVSSAGSTNGQKPCFKEREVGTFQIN